MSQVFTPTGVLKNPQTYEPFSPDEVGWKRRLVVGKHSGRHLLTNLLSQHGVNLDHEESQVVLESVSSSFSSDET